MASDTKRSGLPDGETPPAARFCGYMASGAAPVAHYRHRLPGLGTAI